MMTLLVDSTAKTTEIGSCELLARQHGKRPRAASSILSDGNKCSTIGADEAGDEKGISRDSNVDQHKQRTTCSREHFRPGYAFPYLARTTERPRAQLDSDNQAFGEAEAMAENEERSSPRSLQVPRCSSADGKFEQLTRHSRISTERLRTSRTSLSSSFEDMSPAFRHSQLAAPASTGAITRGMIAGTDMRAPACGPSQTWCSLPDSRSTCHKGSERPGQGSPRGNERSGSGLLVHFKAHRGNLASTSCDLSAGLSQGRKPPGGGDQLDDCCLHGLSGGDSPSGNRCSFSTTEREVLQTTMDQFDSASNTVRRDLQLYMKAVREK